MADMPLIPPEQGGSVEQPKPRRNAGVFFIVAMAAVVFVLAGGYYWYMARGELHMAPQKQQEVSLAGKLYYMLGPSDPRSPADGSYEYDLAADRQGVPKFAQDQKVFRPTITEGYVAGIFRDKSGAQIMRVQSLVGSTTLYDHATENKVIGSLSLAHDLVHIAYSILPTATPYKDVAMDSDKGVIAIERLTDGTTDTFKGIAPRYASGGQLFYIGQDGLYEAMPSGNASSTSHAVWPFEAGTTGMTYMRIAVADGAPLLAFSDALADNGKGAITLFDIGADGSLTKKTTISTSASEMALSPDGAYLAVQIRSDEKGSMLGSGNVAIYDLSNGKVVKTLSISSSTYQPRLVTWVN